ncbi:hexose transporter [Hypoxylon rubiginosum]|uniref:Hexose transporter n=1 Tax=Hypoxylon rubiginosum TaxID=110542 RepID=A0ACB9YYW5_9PEZI|nr:hexose transporter [Hypoxylon rubiginosum]
MKDADIVGSVLAEVLPQTDKWWFQQRHLLRLNMLLLVPLLSSAVSGYDGSLMNGLQSLQQWRDYFGHPTGATLGLVNAAQSIGSVLALPFIGNLSDRFGRKPVLLTGILLVIAATIIQGASINFPMFVISRLIVGFGGMFVVQPSPMLIAELAYPTHRGKYTSAFWTMYYLGAILASWTTFGCQNYESDWAWRTPSILQAGYPLIQLAFFYWVPESPRWLVAQDRAPEAAAILSYYHAGMVNASNEGHTPLVTRELAEIVSTIQREKSAETVGWGALFSTRGNRKRTLIAVCVGAFAQWNGIGVVSYYLTLVLNTIGITDTFTQTLINGLLQIFNFGAALSAAILVDRLGRRTFFFHYDIAYTPLLLGYPTEIFTYTLRSKGIALELMAIYVSLTIQAFVNPIGMENIGWKYYIVFCCLLVVFLAVTWVLFPETKGHSLEDIAVLFDGPEADEARVDAKIMESEMIAHGTHHDEV